MNIETMKSLFNFLEFSVYFIGGTLLISMILTGIIFIVKFIKELF